MSLDFFTMANNTGDQSAYSWKKKTIFGNELELK